tara:strand:- start:601 stop:1422 length:822 start_codon:yes stop_codon:yes gene_type:complete
MAEGKKSFIMYTDAIHTIKLLSDEDAGKLLKHLFAYVNDENPVVENPMIALAFEPIKQSLKRDLERYDGRKTVNSDKGKMGNLKRWNKDLYELVLSEKMTLEDACNIAKDRSSDKVSPTIAVNDSDSDSDSGNDSDSVNDNDIKPKKKTKASRFTPKVDFNDLELNELINEHLKIRKEKKKQPTEYAYKLFLDKLEKLSSGNIETKKQMLREAIESSWITIYPLKNNNGKPTVNNPKPTTREKFIANHEENGESNDAYFRAQFEREKDEGLRN